MHFACVRCARKHSFPAARTGAGGRVPCKCGATLVLQPPPERTFSSPDFAEADVATLGYRITVEPSPRWFDAAHAALRAGIGLSAGDAARPDPASAGRPALLWPALAAACDPRLWLLPAALFLGVLLIAPVTRLAVPEGDTAPLAALLGQVLLASLAAALGALSAAVALHELLVDGRPLSAARALRSLLGGARVGVAAVAARRALARGAAASACLLCAAALARFGSAGGGVAAALAPLLGLVLCACALAAGALLVGSLATLAAVAPSASGLRAVQVALDARRLAGPGGRLLVGRPFVAGLAATVAVALALAGLVALADEAWARVLAVAGPATPPPDVRAALAESAAVGQALLIALAGGVWAAFLGAAGLLAGYAASAGVPPSRARPSQVLTGTRPAMQAVVDDEVATAVEKNAAADSLPPPSDED